MKLNSLTFSIIYALYLFQLPITSFPKKFFEKYKYNVKELAKNIAILNNVVNPVVKFELATPKILTCSNSTTGSNIKKPKTQYFGLNKVK